MVKTRSVDNYEKFLKELTKEFNNRYGKHYTEKYINFIRQRYDKFDRVFLDKNVMFKLRDDFASVRGGNIIFYLCVGLGFVGKTTFFKNVAYFFDDKFRNKNLGWGFDDMVDILQEFTIKESFFRALIVDEPTDFPHPQSRKGKKFTEIMGQVRQLSPVLLFCSTDFKDMPPTIMRKLHGLFYLNVQGHGYFIRNAPEDNEYPLDEFKRKFNKEGYQVINDILNKFPNLEFNTSAACVMDNVDVDGEKKYKKDKLHQLQKSIKDYKKIKDVGSGRFVHLTEEEKEERYKKIAKWLSDGETYGMIAQKLNLSSRQITNIVNQYKG